jgi:hypothetical protein
MAASFSVLYPFSPSFFLSVLLAFSLLFSLVLPLVRLVSFSFSGCLCFGLRSLLVVLPILLTHLGLLLIKQDHVIC